jgi:hypothetical protein
MTLKPKALVAQMIADLLLVAFLAAVSALIGIRGLVRGARAVGLLPPKPESIVY